MQLPAFMISLVYAHIFPSGFNVFIDPTAICTAVHVNLSRYVYVHPAIRKHLKILGPKH